LDNREIWVIGMEDVEDRSAFQRISQMRFGHRRVPLETIASGVQELLQAVSIIFSKMNQFVKMEEYSLEEVSLSVEVSAKGRVSLLGSGGEAGGLGGLTFVLKRKK